jgi:hypothetical protein
MFFSRNERAFGVRYYSTARHALSDHSLYRLPCAAHPVSPSCMLPKGLYNSARRDKLPECGPKACGKLFESGHLSRKRPPAATVGIVQSKPIACLLFSARMTKARPIPVPSSQARLGPAFVKYYSRAGAARLFFEPTTNSVTSHTESASQAAQTASFFVCAQDFLTFFLRVTNRLRVVATTASAFVALIALFAISSQAIAHDIVTTAMAAL